jgi:tetrahydromethanopterin S-methyltransferase subunit G
MPPEIDQLAHKVNQQGVSLRAISDTVIDTKTIIEQHTGRLTAIQRTLGLHGRRFDKIDERLDGMHGRLDDADGRFDGVDERLDGMDRRFDEINGTLAEVLRRLPEPPA